MKPHRTIPTPLLLVGLALVFCCAGPAFAAQEGLIVLVGDSTKIADFVPEDQKQLQGAVTLILDPDASRVPAAREALLEKGLLGRTSVDALRNGRLPLAENMVNIVVDADELLDESELLRVLAPGGVAHVGGKDSPMRRLVGPEQENTDEWPQFLHGPDGNAVAEDTQIGPPNHYRWISGPKFARGHEQLASVSGVVSAGGILYSIQDEAPIASGNLPSEWWLVARDAYNGIELWRKPIEEWEGQHRPFRSGPPEISRRLLAVERYLFVTLGYGQPVSGINGRTGEIVGVYEGTEGAIEIVEKDKVLYIVMGTIADQAPEAAERRGAVPTPRERWIKAVDINTGKTLWEKRGDDTNEMMSLSLAISDDDKLLFHNLDDLICLDAKSGEELWRTERLLARKRRAWSVPTVVVKDGVVLVADEAGPKSAEEAMSTPLVQWDVTMAGGGKNGELVAYNLQTGKELWRCPCAQTYTAPPDVFVTDGMVWIGQSNARRGPDFTQVRDLQTGEVQKQLETAWAFANAGMPHHRCYRNKATSEYLVLGRVGVELIGVENDELHRHHWVRGTCQYGVMPCNGLLYAPPHSCACFLKGKLNHFNALATDRSAVPEEQPPALEKGPAHGAPLDSVAGANDWPTYRYSLGRGGATPMALSSGLETSWEIQLPGQLTSPVCAEGKILVAAKDAHTVFALDATTGDTTWTYTTSGRIDSPPTVADGRAVFGSKDGYVYCLRMADGALIWRYRAAPEDRRIVVYDQLESVWPVHGSVLVKDGVVSLAAGRNSFVDGGIRMLRLDLETGKLLSQSVVSHRDPETGHQPDDTINRFEMDGAMPDVLSTDGECVYMRHLKLNPETLEMRDDPGIHLFTPTGFLDDSWWHRTYWLYGDHFVAGWGGWWNVSWDFPSGRIMSMDDETIYGFGRNYTPGGNAWQWSNNEHYQIFAADRKATEDKIAGVTKQAAPDATAPAGQKKPVDVAYHWQRRAPLAARALCLTANVLYIAGPLGDVNHETPALHGEQGVQLQAISKASGETLATYELDAMPVFDGMIAADGALILTLEDGRVVRMSEK